MKKLAVFICISAMSLSVMAQESLRVAELKGSIELKNADDQLVRLPTQGLKFELEAPSIFSSPVRHFKKERVLTITASGEEFSFRIPNKLITSYGNFSVRKDWAEQNAHVQSALLKTEETFVEVEKIVDCYYSQPEMVTVMKSDGSVGMEMQIKSYAGEQRARVRVDKWIQQFAFKIYNDTGYVELKSYPKKESSDTILKTLSSCR